MPYKHTPILFLDMPFQSGNCLERIRHIKNGKMQNLAMMQYYYFTCHHEQALEKAREYLKSENPKIQIDALLIYIFSSIAMGHTKQAQNGIFHLKKLISRRSDFSRESGIPLMLSVSKILLHIPITETERKEIDAYNRECTEGGRLLCCYLLEQSAWANREYERIIGVVETALHMTINSYPLITLYFYLSASEAALYLKDINLAEIYFEKAWKLAEADGFWAPVCELHGHLQLFLEKKVKYKNPETYKQLMHFTHQYRSGWRNLIHDEIQPNEEYRRKNALETLTGMEYAVAFLAGLGWSNQEIGDYFFISVRTVKYYMTAIFRKLNIDSRHKISVFLLD